MSIDAIARAYLQRLQQAVIGASGAGAGSLELATRPVVTAYFLEKVVNALKPGAVVHNELQVGSANRPDWRIDDPETFGVYAYGDHKGLSLNNPLQLTKRDKEQVLRYLDLGRPVFVFDGVEFLFYQGGNAPSERIELVRKPLDPKSDWSTLPVDPAVEIRLRSLLEAPGFRKWTETELMEQLAGRTRLLSTSIATLLEAPIGSGKDAAEEELLGALRTLFDLARENHDPGLTDPHSCADFIAQVLVFGLFYAHTSAPEHGQSPDERRQHISDFWQSEAFSELAEKLRPFQTIVKVLGNALSTRNDLSVWYEEAATVLAHAEYMGAEVEPIDFHALFERFLESFDKQTKFDRGVFYTPSSVTEWMTRITDQLLHAYLGGGMDAVVDKLIDPCCGTGGFLESAIRVVGDVPNGPHFIGFEVLPAPYALAHYRLAAVGEGWDHQPSVSIALTDTLSDRLADPPQPGKDGFSDELAAAAEWSDPPVRVVIGNPPSSTHNFSQAPRTLIEKLIEEFRPPRGERRSRQNIQKALRNEAYRFLRWSAKEVLESGTGIVALVLPGAFAYAVSFSYARKWLLDSFDEVYVLVLDRDLRTGQSTGQSMFDVRQGRLIMFAVRALEGAARGEGNGQTAAVYVRDISGLSKEEKEVFLGVESPKFGNFSRISTSEPHWRFQETTYETSDLWSSCWPLRNAAGATGIFTSKCSAVKLAPTALVFHTDLLILERRSRALASRSGTGWSKTNEDLREEWWKGQKKPPNAAKLTDGVRQAAAAAARAGAVTGYTFRPFVDGFVLNNDKLFEELTRTAGGGTRPRPEIRAAFTQGAYGIAVAPAPIDLGSSLTRFVSFCWQLPDNDICARQNAMIYCDISPAEKKGANWDSTAYDNIAVQFSALFQDHRDAIFYVYAVMSSEIYLDTFESRIYQPSDPDNPPRIPVADDPEIREHIAELGRRAAECERPSEALQDMGIDTSWSDDLDELKVERYSVDPDAGTVIISGPGGASVTITNVPSYVLTLRISGHDVVDKWLRERSYPYLRRAFRKYDLTLFVDLLTRISRQLEVLTEVSTLLDDVLVAGQLLPPPALD
ncbi:hypothetical protein DQP55_02900 [Mycolicibacterium sp. GF69]|uniref:type ISP restriction/modification enzyme n=1 Tax=Mycolicibacterium sp. GF69 TaxID=2267251 RepID=UPI000DCBA795|nr:type ISP restriction/modification enzyme [Mycolicibacterium sp. GF69]RAV16980.1 hypothetical protein DQP55_02900 [Mycolicibacterium sp. GF69]